MNWLKRKIVDCANAIKESEAKKSSRTNEDTVRAQYAWDALKAAATEEIWRNLKAYQSQALKLTPDLKFGDEAVFNAFGLLGYRHDNNAWDGGAHAFLQHLHDDERLAGIKVKIKEVKLNTTYVEQRIDRFFEKVDRDTLECKPMIWPTFVKMMCPSVQDSMFDRFGFYWSATFESNARFKPKWELHVDAFIKKGTPGYDETIKIAESKVRLEQIKREHLELVSSIEQEIGSIKRSVMVSKDLTTNN